VWCTGQQQSVLVSWIGAGQAYLCMCDMVHEVVERFDCAKAWDRGQQLR
jgi:hypothetical protein